MLFGPVHAVDLKSAIQISSAMTIGPGSKVLEVGCGVPRLAAVFSAVSATSVLCTERPDVYDQLRTIVEACQPADLGMTSLSLQPRRSKRSRNDNA